MEEVRAVGDIAAERNYLSLTQNTFPHRSDGIIRKSTLLSAENGQLPTFILLWDQLGESVITRPVLNRICRSTDRLDFCAALLERGWSLNGCYDGSTPLYVGSTRWLLDHGANPNQLPLTNKNIDLLAAAAAKSPPGVVQLLLDRGAKVRGTPALHMAVMFSAERANVDEWVPDPSRVDVLRMLLDAGADVNEMGPDPKGPGSLEIDQAHRSPWTGTPLHYGVKSGSLGAVGYLLGRGADLNAPSWSGHTALQAAEKTGRRDVIALINQNQS